MAQGKRTVASKQSKAYIIIIPLCWSKR